MRRNEWLPDAVVVLDLRSKRVRTLATFGNKDEPTTVVWSPDGRYVALAESEGFSMRDYTFAVIDVATARPVLSCTSARRCTYSADRSGTPSAPLAWAPDSRSLFTGSGERLDLRGRYSPVVKGGTGFALTALDSRLIYDKVVFRGDTVTSDTLYLLDLKTGHRKRLLVSRWISAVRPLARLP